MSTFSPSSFLSLFDGSVVPFEQSNQSNNQSTLFDLSCFYDEAAVQIPDNAVNSTTIPLQPTSRQSNDQSNKQSNNQTPNKSKRSSGELPFLDLPSLTSWMSNLFTEDEPVDQSIKEGADASPIQSNDQSINQSTFQASSRPNITSPQSASQPSTRPLSEQGQNRRPKSNNKSIHNPTNQSINQFTTSSINKSHDQSAAAQSLDQSARPVSHSKSAEPVRGRPVNRAVGQSKQPTDHARPHRSPVLWSRTMDKHKDQSVDQSINQSIRHKNQSVDHSIDQPGQSISPQINHQAHNHSDSQIKPSPIKPRKSTKPVLNVKCLSDSTASISLSPEATAEHPINQLVNQSILPHVSTCVNHDTTSIQGTGQCRADAYAANSEAIVSLADTDSTTNQLTATLSVATQMPSPAAHVSMTQIGSALQDANLDYFAADASSMIVVDADEQSNDLHSDTDSADWEEFDEADEIDDIVDIDLFRSRQRGTGQQITAASPGDGEWTRVDEMSSSQSSDEFEILDEQVEQQL